MSTATPSLSDDDVLPPPPMMKEGTAQLLSDILGDESDEDNIQDVTPPPPFNGTNGSSPLETKKEEVVAVVETTMDRNESIVTEEEGGSDDDESYDDDDDDDSDGEYSVEEEEEEVILTTMEEKHSLIALAAEHDRVDILQAILDQESPENKIVLLNNADGQKSPLEIAFQCQSTNATACLLRMGAIPTSFSKNFQHAFEAEALRAIGADEWSRLQQLMNVLPTNFTIAHRSLYEWSIDMNATQCSLHLKPQQQKQPPSTSANDTNQSSNATSTDTPSTTLNHESKSENEQVDENGDNQNTPSTTTKSLKFVDRDTNDECAMLQKQLEESESLSTALSNLLDTLAEEVSVTQGLLYNKNALLSHIKAIKNVRAQKEDELQEWNSKLQSHQSELEMVTDYWYNYTNPDSDSDDDDYDDDGNDEEYTTPILPLPTPSEKTEFESFEQDHKDVSDDSTVALNSSNNGSMEKGSKHTKEQWLELLECSKLRVTKLRASLTDLAEEKDANLKEIEKRGLSGAVRMAQNLRDEVRELDYELNSTRSEVATIRLQIDTIRAALERLMNPPSNDNDQSDVITEDNTPYLELEPPSPTYDEPNNSNQVNGENSTNAATTSNVVVPYRIQKGYLPLHIWDLILRIFGLGKKSVHKAVLGK